ncbi:long-chain-fatty-acid--CoA ligase [Ferroplasma acidiphilum]|jgi:long-chain acyl-CoA synthetase|uniref:Long-chain fatty acid--CoA ligase n=1 Tax=Ferroplasma acidiphilum TaxID=74969 RepID=A0A7K4FQL0_9ARCH|nr:long-chain fatty acid--CoA ligase [Ferroplasma acidiphilum]NOL61121.1 long-chain fatty acid--CoA ligase [Ferroplasma acidiphilum]
MIEVKINSLDEALQKSYPPWVRRTIEIPDISIYRAFSDSVEKNKDNIAIDFMGNKITYSSLKEKIDSISVRLGELGITKGDRIAVMLPNIPQYITYFFAIVKLGAIIVQVNPLYTMRELEFEIKDSGANTLIVMDDFIDKALPLYPAKLKRILVVKVQYYLPPVVSQLYTLIKKEHKKIPVADNIYLCKVPKKSKLPSKEADIDPENDPALLQYTGGTTGLPKAAILTHKNLISNAYQIIEYMPDKYKKNISYLSSIPFFHVYGMMTAMLTPLLQGSKIILIPDPRDIKTALKIIDKKKPVAFPGIPTLYHGIITYKDVKKYHIDNVKICISGASPLPVELQKNFESMTGAILVEGYGLSECSPVANVTPLVEDDREKYRRFGSVGLPVSNTYEKIVSTEDGVTEMPLNEPGELVIKGPQVMKGYWNRPDENAKTMVDGWLHTGDIAKMDEEGYVYIVDREKDLIIAGGYNIYPREVEEVIYENPKVSECAVIGVKDAHRGETVKAFIVKKDSSLTDAEIINFCKERLAVYKVPKIIEFRDELPLTLVGKVDKKALRGGDNGK